MLHRTAPFAGLLHAIDSAEVLPHPAFQPPRRRLPGVRLGLADTQDLLRRTLGKRFFYGTAKTAIIGKVVIEGTLTHPYRIR